MHDPEVLVFDLHLPVPVRKWRHRGANRWAVRRRWYIEDGPVDPWWRPSSWEVVAGGWLIGWWPVVDVWHIEPNGGDSGSICKGLRSSNLTPANIKWAALHFRHLKFNVLPVRRIQRWLTLRCDDCGLRFHWKESPHGYMSSDAKYHGPCMTVRHLRGKLQDLTDYVDGTADDNATWRVEYEMRLRGGTTPNTDIAW